MNKRFWLKTGFPVWACFDGDGGSGGDGGGTGGAAGAGNANAGGQQADGSGGGETKPFATFPDQASFDARMKREGRAQLESLAKEMGFDTVEAMQAAAKVAKEAEEKNKSEAEKEKARADKAEAEKATAQAKANKKLVDADLKVFAAQAGFADPSDAVALAERSVIKVDDDGNVTGAKEAIEALAKAKPHLLGKAGGGGGVGSAGSPPGGGGSGNLTEEEQGRKIAEERNKAKKEQASGGVNPWATS